MTTIQISTRITKASNYRIPLNFIFKCKPTPSQTFRISKSRNQTFNFYHFSNRCFLKIYAHYLPMYRFDFMSNSRKLLILKILKIHMNYSILNKSINVLLECWLTSVWIFDHFLFLIFIDFFVTLQAFYWFSCSDWSNWLTKTTGKLAYFFKLHHFLLEISRFLSNSSILSPGYSLFSNFLVAKNAWIGSRRADCSADAENGRPSGQREWIF